MKFSKMLPALGLAAMATHAQAQIPSNFIARYPFDSSLVDIATTPANATVFNGTISYGTDRFGNANRAASFNGSTMLKAINSKFLVDTAFTLAAWVRPTSYESWGTIAGVRYNASSSPYNSYMLSINGVTTRSNGFITTDSSYTDAPVTDTSALPLNTWTHVAVSYSRGAQKFSIYINGQLRSQTTVKGKVRYNTNSPYFGIGDVASVNGNSWNGLMDDLTLYGRALTPAQIDSLAYPVNTTGLTTPIAHYRFDSTLQDATVNQLHASAVTGSSFSYTTDRLGRPHHALHIDSTNQATIQAISPLFRVDTAVTITAWVRPTAFREWGMVASLRFNENSSPYNSYSLMAGTGCSNSTCSQISLNTANDIMTTDPTTNHLPLNQWTHIAMSYSYANKGVRLYVNGTQVAYTSALGSFIYSDSSLTIGNIIGANQHNWAGDLDEVIIYGRSLTASEIAYVANPLVTQRPVQPQTTIAQAPSRQQGINADEEGQLTIYPNPANTNVTINATSEIESIIVSDFSGRVVMQQNKVKTNIITLDVAQLPTSMYAVRATLANGQVITQKFVVSK